MNSKAFAGFWGAAHSKGLKYKAGTLLIPLLAPLLAFAQADPDARVTRAYALELQNQSAKALALIRPLVNTGAFQGAELGKAWTVLGRAYTDENEFREAQHAYEQAISILQPMAENVRDYATAISSFADFYRVEGQFQVSVDLRLKALRIYKNVGDHAGIAITSDALADLALRQGQMKEGKKYYKQVADEMKAGTELSDDNLATILTTQAQIARVGGNPSAAIAAYEHALQILKRLHEADHPTVAWEYMLLGIAYADTNNFEDALREMRLGLSILDRTWGHKDTRYLEAEIAYCRVLDRSGDHEPAALLRTADEATLRELKRAQCVRCTISAEALR